MACFSVLSVDIFRQTEKKTYKRALEKCKVKYTCECGSVLRPGDNVSHEKAKKHQAYIYIYIV